MTILFYDNGLHYRRTGAFGDCRVLTDPKVAENIAREKSAKWGFARFETRYFYAGQEVSRETYETHRAERK